MNFKKIGVTSIIIALLAISLVSAQYDFRGGSQRVINIFVESYEPFIQAILGGNEYTGFLLFEKFLLFILLLGIVYISLNNIDIFSENKAVHVIVAIIVPVLSVRAINLAWLNTLILQYQVLAIALTGILPFIIYLFFLHGVAESPTVRKIGWIFFIIVYLGLWITSETLSYSSVYFWTMIIALIFLLMDGTIHRYYMNQNFGGGDKWQYIMGLKADIRQIKESVTRENFPEAKANKLIRKKQKKINWWMKQ